MAGDIKREREIKVVSKPTDSAAAKDAISPLSSLTKAGMFSKSSKNASAATVKDLLQAIVNGEQDKAEALLIENRNLLLEVGHVTDAGSRCFNKITGFQLAVWQLDKHMWEMILNYISTQEAAKQFKELEDMATNHGPHFDLTPLIETLGNYIQNYENPSSDLDECSKDWCKNVGAKQALLVPHVVNEYCRLDRSFSPDSNFDEPPLPRTRRVYADWDAEEEEEWFSLTFKKGKLGETFAYERGTNDAVMMGSLCQDVEQVKMDLAALKQLYVVRKQQYQSLGKELLEQLKPECKEEATKQRYA